ncbi:MAG: GIY-YIG nuclease family protein [Brevundimonas sp.]
MTDALTHDETIFGRRGHVYILTNDAMPGLVKIGRTAREVDRRAAELWQTGVPSKFDVYASVKSFDCVQLEAFMHGEFASRRVQRSREFFKVKPDEATAALKRWLLVQTDMIVGELDTGFTVAPYDESIDPEAVQRLSQELQQPRRVIAEAMEALTADELRAAVLRARERLQREDPDYLAMIDRAFAEGR